LTVEDRFAGSTDVALSDEGREQARRLSERLQDEKMSAVYASPLGRTMETAAIIAAPHHLEVVRCDVEKKFPEEAAAWEEDPYTFAPPGGESGLAVTARALPVLLEIVRTHACEAVAVVSHKATIRLLLSSLLGFDPRRYRDNLDQSPAALNIIDFRDAAHARLTLFNDTSHYSLVGNAIPSVPTARLSKWWNEATNAARSS
jgi:probable phosphoglycerate mutase